MSDFFDPPIGSGPFLHSSGRTGEVLGIAWALPGINFKPVDKIGDDSGAGRGAELGMLFDARYGLILRQAYPQGRDFIHSLGISGIDCPTLRYSAPFPMASCG